MMNMQHVADEWMAVNRHQMVNCLYQPGNLLISKQACKARREKAKQENLDDSMQGDFFEYIHKKGLAICLACSNGDTGRRKASSPASRDH